MLKHVKMSSIAESTCQDWTEKLIHLISGRPAIFNKDLKEHQDKKIVTKLWNEIYEEVIPGWSEISTHEKTIKGRDVQRRWRNLRTCFKRELNKQSSGHYTIKRHKYLYFDQLRFLLPGIQAKDTVGKCSSPQASNEEVSFPEDSVDSNDTQQKPSILSSKSVPHLTNKRKRGLQTLTKKEPSLPSTHSDDSLENPKTIDEDDDSFFGIPPKASYNDTIDEDKMFLLSLVPSFRRMNDTQKLEVKIEFLSTIKRITETQSNF